MMQQLQSYYDEDTGQVLEAPVEMPVWVEPLAAGEAPMCRALFFVRGLIGVWTQTHGTSFPPIILHVTAGRSQDGDPCRHAEAIRRVETQDGRSLLFHCQLSSASGEGVLFPHQRQLLPDDLSRRLFDCSSELPKSFCRQLSADGFDLRPGARGMAVNAELRSVLRCIQVDSGGPWHTADD
jgi:hypothetical protein